MHCCVLFSLASLSASMSSLNALFMAAGTARGAQIVAQILGAGEEEGPTIPRWKSDPGGDGGGISRRNLEVRMDQEARVWRGNKN